MLGLRGSVRLGTNVNGGWARRVRRSVAARVHNVDLAAFSLVTSTSRANVCRR